MSRRLVVTWRTTTDESRRQDNSLYALKILPPLDSPGPLTGLDSRHDRGTRPRSTGGGTMSHVLRAGIFVIFALILATIRVAPASADELTANTVDQALAAVGQTALTDDVDTDGSITTGGVTISGEGETVARTTETGAQVISVLREGDQASFTLDLPAGAELVEGPAGTVTIVQLDADGGRTLGLIQAPWAVDAAGKALPTEYTIEGNTLVQDVDTEGATYPVVADPEVSVGWDWPWGPIYKIRFSKGNVNYIIENHWGWATMVLMGLVCTVVGWASPAAGGVCMLIGLGNAESIVGSFRNAYQRDPNNCVYMKMTTTGIPLEWYRYNCDDSKY